MGQRNHLCSDLHTQTGNCPQRPQVRERLGMKLKMVDLSIKKHVFNESIMSRDTCLKVIALKAHECSTLILPTNDKRWRATRE